MCQKRSSQGSFRQLDRKKICRSEGIRKGCPKNLNRIKVNKASKPEKKHHR